MQVLDRPHERTTLQRSGDDFGRAGDTTNTVPPVNASSGGENTVKPANFTKSTESTTSSTSNLSERRKSADPFGSVQALYIKCENRLNALFSDWRITPDSEITSDSEKLQQLLAITHKFTKAKNILYTMGNKPTEEIVALKTTFKDLIIEMIRLY